MNNRSEYDANRYLSQSLTGMHKRRLRTLAEQKKYQKTHKRDKKIK